jgi:hypothetical protein
MKTFAKYLEEIWDECEVGDRVYIAKSYGGGSGIVIDNNVDKDFPIIKIKGTNKSFHVDNVFKTKKEADRN